MRRLLLVAATLPALALAACSTSPTGSAGSGTGTGSPTGSPTDDETVPQFAGNRLTRVDWRGTPVAGDPLVVLAKNGGIPTDQLFAVNLETDSLGLSHLRVQQMQDGVPVMGGDAIVHLDPKGDIYATSGNLLVGVNVETTTPAIMADQATDALLAYLAAEGLTDITGASLGTPSLVIVPTAKGDRLVWSSSSLIESKHADPMQIEAMVDAIDGTIIQAFDALRSEAAVGLGNSLYLGKGLALDTNYYKTGGRKATWTYEMRDTVRGGTFTADMKNRLSGYSIFTSANDVFGDGTAANRATSGVDAAVGAALTWDYYKNVHGRNGIGNDAKGSSNRVHYSRNYNNAFWSDSCFCMTYGDGDGVTFSNFAALDVAGHEMSHGVTAKTANLTYSGESGGLNEATSDIFGTCVEFYANNANDEADWLIGEKITLKRLATNDPDPSGGKYLRSMAHPTYDGNSVDNYANYDSSLNVHYSSGIANNFFYLLAQGGTNDTSGLTVTGIGRDKAEKIWYRALTVYMTSSTDYAGARAATLSAAIDLYAADSAEVQAVAAGWDAVGVH
jgi:Zn-dependent metalloprotease